MQNDVEQDSTTSTAAPRKLPKKETCTKYGPKILGKNIEFYANFATVLYLLLSTRIIVEAYDAL